MLVTDSAVYVGHNYEDGYLGYFTEDNLFFVMSVEEGLTEAKGEKILNNIRDALLVANINNLAKFEAKISDLILKENMPAHVSVAAGFIHNNILYVKTMGAGEVYFRRSNDFAQLISGDNSASGYIKAYDCVVFTTKAIKKILGPIGEIKSFLDLNPPEDIVNKLNEEQYGPEDRGFIAAFVEFLREEDLVAEEDEDELLAEEDAGGMEEEVEGDEEEYEEDEESEEEEDAEEGDEEEEIEEEEEDESDDESEDQEVDEVIPVRRRSAMLQNDTTPPWVAKVEGIKNQFKPVKLPKNKRITMIAVLVIFVILVWSVVFGYQRRVEAQMNEKIETTKQSITKKLTEAEESAFLNLDKSMSLISESRTEVTKLKSELGKEKQKEVTSLEQLINDKESQIVKKEEKNFDEFYDLALENKDASGDVMTVDEENVAILDSKKSTVYMLSLDKKSIIKYTASEVSSAEKVGIHNEEIYFFSPTKGIYKFTAADKIKKLIAADKEWGTIVDMQIYGGNIYLMDTDKNQIYKYLVTESGYSDKTSYFSDDQVDLKEGTSFTIDGSVYVSLREGNMKFTKGATEDFKTSFPTSKAEMTKIYTNADVEQVYVWDKTNGAVYVLDKKGIYQRQIKASILAKATDFFIYDGAIFALSEQKIYKIEL